VSIKTFKKVLQISMELNTMTVVTVYRFCSIYWFQLTFLWAVTLSFGNNFGPLDVLVLVFNYQSIIFLNYVLLMLVMVN